MNALAPPRTRLRMMLLVLILASAVLGVSTVTGSLGGPAPHRAAPMPATALPAPFDSDVGQSATCEQAVVGLTCR